MPRLTQTRRELLGALMRDAIYEAAVAVLKDHGVDGLTMDRVAAEAQVAKGSLYNYFRDKRELLQLVHERMVGPMIESLREISQGDASAVQKIRMFLHMLFERLGPHREVIAALIRDERARAFLQGPDKGFRGAGIHHLSAIFQQGIEEGVFRPLDPELLANLFSGGIAYLIEHHVITGRHQSEEMIDALSSVFLTGVGLPGCLDELGRPKV